MTQEEIKKLSSLKWEDIDKETAIGQLLSSAVCILCFVRFRDKKPRGS
jgi:hypothetical protein